MFYKQPWLLIDIVFKLSDLHLDSSPAYNHVSHWWQKEGHLAKIAPSKCSNYLDRHVTRGSAMFKFEPVLCTCF